MFDGKQVDEVLLILSVEPKLLNDRFFCRLICSNFMLSFSYSVAVHLNQSIDLRVFIFMKFFNTHIDIGYSGQGVEVRGTFIS